METKPETSTQNQKYEDKISLSGNKTSSAGKKALRVCMKTAAIGKKENKKQKASASIIAKNKQKDRNPTESRTHIHPYPIKENPLPVLCLFAPITVHITISIPFSVVRKALFDSSAA